MKQLYSLLFLLLLALTGRSQCDSPEIIEWTALPNAAFEITYYSAQSGMFDLILTPEHLDVESAYTYAFEGQEGINYIELDQDLELFPGWEEVYWTCEFHYICEDLETQPQPPTVFYMSHHSLLNEDDFDCDSLVMAISDIEDEPGFITEVILPYTGNEGIVESIEVFVDIAHDNNSDLFIELEHPNGLTTTLLDGGLNSDNTLGFSVLFNDNASIFPQNLNATTGPRGTFLPVEPLSTFAGLPTAGDWVLRVIDNSGTDNGVLYSACLSVTCQTNFSGQTFFDMNTNGIQDENDFDFALASIENSIDDNTYYSNQVGEFSECADPGTGSLEILNIPTYYTAVPVDLSIIEGEQIENIEIAVTPLEDVVDIKVDLLSLQANRPGFHVLYKAIIENIGTICGDDVSVSISFPDYTEFIDSDNPALNYVDNIATLDIEEVCPFLSEGFFFEIVLDDTVSLGTILDATISATVAQDDPNELNNTFTFTDEVVGSYDPNDKQVSHEVIGDEFLAEESPLKYTIRFQNTGTFYAERVVIVDTIDTDLDINSLNITSISHEMELSREGNVVFFEFDQIFLPDSTTDFEGSIGHVRYEIDPLPTFSEGDLIENTAHIYFDFNEPIVTNTVVTEFGNPLKTFEEADFELNIFPNPATDLVTVTWSKQAKPVLLEIMDISGRIIELIRLGEEIGTTQISIGQLDNGLYLIRLSSGNSSKTSTFIKS